jgi:hypothetical protein
MCRYLGVRLLFFGVALIHFSIQSMTYGQTVAWIRQFGSNQYDINRAVSVDGLGSVYTSGFS